MLGITRRLGTVLEYDGLAIYFAEVGLTAFISPFAEHYHKSWLYHRMVTSIHTALTWRTVENVHC